MRCNKCGMDLPAGAQFCPGCGTKNTPEMTCYCANCGRAMSAAEPFCPKCGVATGGGAQNYNNMGGNDHTMYVQPTPDVNNSMYSQPVPGKKNNTAVIVAVVAAVAALLIVLCMCAAIAGSNRNNVMNYPAETMVAETPQAQGLEERPGVTEDTGDLETKLDRFIVANASHSDIGVAIIDNHTGERIKSENADSRYTAWGWYLPIYLLYDHYEYYSPEVRRKIMSSDAGVCNSNANTAIRAFGGPAGTTENLEWYFDTDDTVYGRYFGDVNSNSDNYTTPGEAAAYLEFLNGEGERTMLSYDISKYGISAPYGAKIYAQVGTENNNVREELNLFAIVRGNDADYCVAIMTKNNKGKYISDLLDIIHTEMENR